MLTDKQILQIQSNNKVVSNPRSKSSFKGKHIERNYEAEASDGSKYKIFTRQLTTALNCFSCGIMYQMGDASWIILARYNGSDHPHMNPIEKTKFEFEHHIHTATERYIDLGKKPEHYAITTTRYNSIDGALLCLCEDWNVTGLYLKDDNFSGNLFT